MKNPRRFVALFALLALLAGCAGSAVTASDPALSPSAPTPVPSPSPASVSPLPRPAVELDAPVEAAENADFLSDFGIKLLKTSMTEGKNTLLSPLSAVLALGMAANGAQGDTLAELEAVLGLPLDQLNAQCASLLAQYGDLGGSSETSLVNSLWCDERLTLEDAFTARCMDTYAAQLFRRDLQDPATVRALNAWVSEATRGLIPSLVDRFDEQAVLALVNAVYFKNAFQTPFATPMLEWELEFHNADGTVSSPKGMSNGVRTEQYIAAEDGRGVVLPYDDGRLGLLLMLPDEGVSLTDYLAGWDGETVKGLLDARRETELDLRVPRFKAEWSGDLKAALERLGLATPFDARRADFSALGHTEDGEPLFLGQVIHKTAFEVNEKGTEAAAVTAAIMYNGTAMAEPEWIELCFDRPFVYAIVDLRTAAPLFLGTVETLAEG